MSHDKYQPCPCGSGKKLKFCCYEDGRSIILGAIEYARQLGFEPHEDWKISGPIVEGEQPFKRTFTFGHEGKPFYIQGPKDDARKIMKRLGPLFERGEAHFLMVMG